MLLRILLLCNRNQIMALSQCKISRSKIGIPFTGMDGWHVIYLRCFNDCYRVVCHYHGVWFDLTIKVSHFPARHNGYHSAGRIMQAATRPRV